MDLETYKGHDYISYLMMSTQTKRLTGELIQKFSMR